MLILTRKPKECIQLQFPTGSETLEVMSKTTVRIGKQLFPITTGTVLSYNGLDILFKSWSGLQLKLGFTGPQEIKIVRTELL
ncbi:carbon storage regulator [Pseudomonas phage Psp6]|nr:carbon storage regulator [Pseudomonas phage Psp6]